MATATRDMANSDVQGEMEDLKKLAEDIAGDLGLAESCETHTDLLGNLENALASAVSLTRQIREALADAKTNGPEEDDS